MTKDNKKGRGKKRMNIRLKTFNKSKQPKRVHSSVASYEEEHSGLLKTPSVRNIIKVPQKNEQVYDHDCSSILSPS